MPIKSGSYQILFTVRKDFELKAGARPIDALRSGLYVYTGSAMNSLDSRVRRHLSAEKKLRWHIDYLLNSPEVKIVEALIFRSKWREECSRNLFAAGLQDSEMPLIRFGSSDCNLCRSHLVRLSSKTDKQTVEEFVEILKTFVVNKGTDQNGVHTNDTKGATKGAVE